MTIRDLMVLAAKKQAVFTNAMKECGYKTKTTFYSDYSIADIFGLKAIQDTYDKAFVCWKDNFEYITEMAMVLNHKGWEYTKNGVPDKIGKLYFRLYEDIEHLLLGYEDADGIFQAGVFSPQQVSDYLRITN